MKSQRSPLPNRQWQLRLPGDELLISGALKEIAHKLAVQNMYFD